MPDAIGMLYTKTVESLSDAARALYNAIPNIILAIIILVAGFLVAKVLKKIAVKILRRVGLERATQTSGIDDTLKRLGYRGTTIELIGDIIKIIVWIIALALAANSLNLHPIAELLQSFSLFLPRLIIAILIIIAGIVLIDFVSAFVRTAITLGANERKEKNLQIVGSLSEAVTKLILSLLVIIIILNIIGISSAVLDILFTVVLVISAGIVLIGAKEIVPNFIAGVYLQKAYEEGDIIKIKDSRGKIVSIDMLYTQLESGDKKIFVPNKMLLDDIIEKETVL